MEKNAEIPLGTNDGWLVLRWRFPLAIGDAFLEKQEEKNVIKKRSQLLPKINNWDNTSYSTYQARIYCL